MSSARENAPVRPAKALLQARLGLAWERFAAVWAPPGLILAGLAVLAIWGAFDALPPAIAAALVAAAVAVAAALAVVNLVRLRWPSRAEARERLVLDYGGEPDLLAAGDARLWALHLQKLDEALARARAGRMGAGIAAADPMALRYALAVAAALGLWAFGPSTGATRVAEAFRPVREAGGEAQVLLARLGDRADDSLQVAGVVLEGLGWPDPSPAAGPARARLERASLQSRAQTPGRPRILPAESSPYPTR